VLVVMLVVSGLSQSLWAAAGEPMPYTDAALQRLNEARGRLAAPKDTQVDAEAKVKEYITAYRQIFAAAGYDYDRSMIRIINDIQFDRYVVNRATIALNALARELLRVHVKTDTNPTRFLGRSFGQLLIDFRDLIRSNTKKYGSC
jgi:hypothetical protein